MAKDNGVGKNTSYPSDSGKYVRMGHTKGNYGNDPGTASANKNPADIRP